MPANPKLLERVREFFEDTSFEEKKMFGGVAFIVRKKMCVTVSSNRIMCRVDPVDHEMLVKLPGVRTVQMKRRDYIGWVFVDESVISDKRRLGIWIRRALAYNEML